MCGETTVLMYVAIALINGKDIMSNRRALHNGATPCINNGRKNNIAVWETMDAGPQVKLITLAEHVERVQEVLKEHLKNEHGMALEMRVCGVGRGAAEVE